MKKRTSADAGAYLEETIVPWTPLFLTLPFSKKEQSYGCQVAETCRTLLMVSVAYGQGRIQRGGMRGMYPSTSQFQKCF